MTGLSRIWLTCKKGFTLGFILPPLTTAHKLLESCSKPFLFGQVQNKGTQDLWGSSKPPIPSSVLYKTLFALSLCFCLGACAGGSPSGSSNSSRALIPETPKESENSKGSKEPKKCNIENGKGQQNWNVSLGKRNDKCELIACNAGYDDHNRDDACEKTPEENYSPAGSNERIACPSKPDHSSWTTATGLTSVLDCFVQAWRCNAGYDNRENGHLCEKTIAGYYSPVGSNARRVCIKPNNSSWTVTWFHQNDATADSASTGLSSANQCWTCNAGYDDHDDDGTCSVTDAGHYSPAGNSDRISCTVPDDATADSASTGLSSANQCWTCNAGYDDHDDDGTCSVTDAGHYSPAGNSDRISCTVPDDATADSASTGLSSANQCWTCNAGYDDHDDDGTCSVTDAGHYSPAENSDRISCTVPDDATADSASTGLSSANQCWTCNAGYDDHDDDGTCSVTDAGYYSPAGNSDRISCTVPDDATADSASTGLSSANQCWTCNAGYVRAGNICARKITALVAGYSHTCALLEDKSVECWGSDYSGQATAPSLNNATALVAGYSHTCALLEDKSVRCWGKHYDRWDGSSHIYVNHIAPSLNNATALVAGYSHTCALLEDKSVRCWGKHYDEWDGSSHIYVNHIAPSLNNAKALVAGGGHRGGHKGGHRGGHTCALLEDKSVECWGSDRYSGQATAPSLNNATALVAGD